MVGGGKALKSSGGRLAHGPTTTLVSRTVSFIAFHLADWRDDPEREDAKAEDLLNLQLCDYLDGWARELFPMVRFTREEPQTGRRSSDVAVKPTSIATIAGQLYTKYNAILVIEGKRLPAPSKSREREYVTGGREVTGGIQRFKLGQHGARDTVALLVGYIQQGNVTLWKRKINAWIRALSKRSDDACTWRPAETLRQTEHSSERGVSALRSEHPRSGNVVSSKIELRHLWVCMHMRKGSGRSAKTTRSIEGR